MTKKKLKEARLNKGLSQETLADLIGMTQCNYSRRENGKKAISDAEWARVSKALDVKKEDIYEPNSAVKSTNYFMNKPFFTLHDYISAYVELQNENKLLKNKLFLHNKDSKKNSF
ncbi:MULTISPECIES: helix-turn-helix transcriptional regulator [unclassified Flavobacterium]|uniref:helix-turn-helix transcriptional regulator n=1 Tax=unclassified Flavobacterium TaxID=196869 RepID=UPI00131AF950|nr:MULTISPECIES: helix-turn-helix transcriptional regulator [unclassified Flavobacterium]